MTIKQILNKPIVFSDFDGTITLHDTFVELLKKFSTPGLADDLMAQMYAQTLTLRAGVTQLLESIPSDQYLNIIEFSKTHPIRSGFPEFLDFLESRNVPCVVISGGIRIMVETVLNEFKPRLAGLHAVDLDSSVARALPGGGFCRRRHPRPALEPGAAERRVGGGGVLGRLRPARTQEARCGDGPAGPVVRPGTGQARHRPAPADERIARRLRPHGQPSGLRQGVTGEHVSASIGASMRRQDRRQRG